MQPSTNKTMLVGVLCTLRLVAPAQGEATASFQGLGDLPGGVFSSQATAISGDGRVVVGTSFSEESGSFVDGFRWTAEAGLQPLARLEGAPMNSIPTRLSHDGSMIVGRCYTIVPGVVVQAVRWIEDGQTIEVLAPGEYSGAYAVLTDGTIVGYALLDTEKDGQRFYPFHWTSSAGMTLILDPLPPTVDPVQHIIVDDASPDGSVMVGSVKGYQSPIFHSFPARWTQSDGWQLVGETSGGVLATNEDGSVLAGYTQVDSLRFAAMWDEEAASWTQIDPYADFANDVTPDGSIIVGGGGVSCDDLAFIWDAGHGSRNLRSLLEDDYGLDLTGWQLTDAQSISDDGRTIVGAGCNPDGNEEGWIVRLPDPCPMDLNDDSVVNVLDLIDLLLCFGQPADPPCDTADVNGDGDVDVLDLVEVLLAFGTSCP